jgi:hypothetical protein
MAISTRLDVSDSWTAQFYRDIEGWFREQYGCGGRNDDAHSVRLGLEQPLAARGHCLGEHVEAEQATWTFRPY